MIRYDVGSYEFCGASELKEYDFLDVALKTTAIGGLDEALRAVLSKMGFDRFAIGRVTQQRAHDVNLLLDKLGDGWWNAAFPRRDPSAQVEFAKLVRANAFSVSMPPRLYAPLSSRLASAGISGGAAAPCITPVKNSNGLSFLLVTGESCDEITDACKTQLEAITAIAVHNFDRIAGSGGCKALSAREREIPMLAARGLASSEIAAEAGITERTVVAHISSASLKLNARNRTAAVVEAIKRGLIPLP